MKKIFFFDIKLTVFISRIRFFGTTLSATGIPSFFRTPA